MAAFDFPAAPRVGDVYVSLDGVAYTWNGYAWLCGASGGGSSAGYVLKSGDIMSGFLTLNADPVQPLHAATKQYVDLKMPPAGLDGQALVSRTGAAVWGATIDAGNF